jgi:hypothetical protein
LEIKLKLTAVLEIATDKVIVKFSEVSGILVEQFFGKTI